MTELEKRLTDASGALAAQYEQEHERQAEQYEAFEEEMKRLETQAEDLQQQQGRTMALAEDLQQQLSKLKRRVELLSTDYKEIACVLSGE